jgi:hypothetical protein
LVHIWLPHGLLKNSLEAGSTQEKKAGRREGAAETLSQQVINNAAAVQR